MAKKPLPSPEVLRQLLRYEADTGKLFWNVRDASFCAGPTQEVRDAATRSWNGNFAGKEALSSEGGKLGYCRGAVLGKSLFAHRVAWAVHFGEWPVGQIDHINGVRTDNRIANLRVVNVEENQRNRATPNTNTSGEICIRWVDAKQKYRVVVGRIQVGQYRDELHAIIARDAAYKVLGYHENHGRKSVLIAEAGE